MTPPCSVALGSVRLKPAFVASLLIVCVWACLYLPNVRTSPPWYGDESLTHHTAVDLAHGQMTNMALWNTFWHPHYPYQPLYTLVCGIFARAFSGDILGSRLFNALLALLCGLSIFLLGRRSFGYGAAAFAALMFLTYEQSVIHFRMSYAHNGAALGLLLMTLFLLRRSCRRNNWLAGLGLALAAGSHPLFVHGAAAGVLCRLKKPSAWLPLLIPAGIYLAVSMGVVYLTFGPWLGEDIVHLKNTFSSRGAEDGGGVQSVINFYAFATQDWFHIGAIAGLLLCLPLRRVAAPLVGLLVLFLLVRNRQNLVLFYYQAVFVLPVLCLGWAGVWKYLETRVRRYAPGVRRTVLALLALPALLFMIVLPASLSGTLRPRNFHWVTQSTGEVEEAAAWLNERSDEGDLVGGNPNIAWLLRAQTVPYLQMITWYGLPTQGYENRNARERFRFDSSLEAVRFAVVGDIDQRWTFGEPNVLALWEQIQREKWPLVWRGQNYLIFANPRFLNAP